jgi:hypothetical protein
MPFDFPSSPSEGQTFNAPGGPSYVFNSPVWRAIGQGQIAVIADNAPANPANGQLWWESDTGILYLWYNDGNSSQWVQVGGIAAAQSALTLPEQATAPATAANIGALYTKDVSGVSELFYRRDSNGSEIQLSNGWLTTGIQTLPTTAQFVTVTLFPGVSMIDISIDLMSSVAAFTPYIQLGNSGGTIGANNYFGVQSAIQAATVSSGLWANNIAQFAGVGHVATGSVGGIVQIRAAGQRFLYQSSSIQIATAAVYVNSGLIANPGPGSVDRVVIANSGGNFDSGTYQVFYR